MGSVAGAGAAADFSISGTLPLAGASLSPTFPHPSLPHSTATTAATTAHQPWARRPPPATPPRRRTSSGSRKPSPPPPSPFRSSAPPSPAPPRSRRSSPRRPPPSDPPLHPPRRRTSTTSSRASAPQSPPSSSATAPRRTRGGSGSSGDSTAAARACRPRSRWRCSSACTPRPAPARGRPAACSSTRMRTAGATRGRSWGSWRRGRSPCCFGCAGSWLGVVRLRGFRVRKGGKGEPVVLPDVTHLVLSALVSAGAVADDAGV